MPALLILMGIVLERKTVLFAGQLTATFFLTCVAYGLFVALGGMVPALPIGVVALLLLSYPDLNRVLGWRLSLGSFILSFCALVWILTCVHYDATTPRQDFLVYAVDTDKRNAFFITDKMDPWTSKTIQDKRDKKSFPQFFASNEDFNYSEAVPMKSAFTRVEVIGEENSSRGRMLNLRFTPPLTSRCVNAWTLDMEIDQTIIDDVQVEPFFRFSPSLDRRLAGIIIGADSSQPWGMSFCAPNGKPFVVALNTKSPGRFELRVVDKMPGLPIIPSLAVERPSEIIPSQWSDQILVSKLHHL